MIKNIEITGEMSERLKEHDWKSCVCPQRCTGGSNPPLSAINLLALLKIFKVHIKLLFKNKTITADCIMVVFDNSNACGKSSTDMNPKVKIGDRFCSS